MSYSLVNNQQYIEEGVYIPSFNLDFISKSISKKLDIINKENYYRLSKSPIDTAVKEHDALTDLKIAKESYYEDEDFIKPSNYVFESVLLILRNISEINFQLYKSLIATHYGTIEIVFEYNNKEMSIEVSDYNTNYFVETSDEDFYTEEFDTKDLNKYLNKLNSDLEDLSNFNQ